MATQQMWVVWVDANGMQSVRSITTQSGAAAILSAMTAYTNAGVLTEVEGDLIVGSPVPASAPYLSATQVAYLNFTDGMGHYARLPLVSPQSSIFQTDGISVNALAIAALISACQGNLLTGAGTLVTAFTGGQLGPGRVNQ